jgi:hypothetical protein
VKSTLIYILPILVLSACSHSDRTAASTSDVELRQKLIGRWRADSRLPGDIHVQSETVVDSDGGYVLHLTNTLVDGVRTITLAGTLQVRDGLLIDTITNNFGADNTLVPRIFYVVRIIRVDEHELTVRSTNNDETITYRKDSR